MACIKRIEEGGGVMGYLSGLKGTDGKNIDCIFIDKGADIESVLGDGLAATTAGDNGAMNVYKDNDGNIRCEIMRYMRTIEEKVFTTTEQAVEWVDEWLPKII